MRPYVSIELLTPMMIWLLRWNNMGENRQLWRVNGLTLMRFLLISSATKMCISFVILADPGVLISVRVARIVGDRKVFRQIFERRSDACMCTRICIRYAYMICSGYRFKVMHMVCARDEEAFENFWQRMKPNRVYVVSLTDMNRHLARSATEKNIWSSGLQAIYFI